MKIGLIVLITIAVIGQLSIGVMGCDKGEKGDKNANTTPDNKNGKTKTATKKSKTSNKATKPAGNKETPTNQAETSKPATKPAGSAKPQIKQAEASNSPATRDGTTNTVSRREEEDQPKLHLSLENEEYTIFTKEIITSATHSTMYKATTKSGAKVSIKLFDASSVDAFTDYRKERDALKQMGASTDNSCKNYGIPTLLGFGRSQTYQVLVMPEFDFTLTSLKKNGVAVSEETYMQIWLELTIALKFMHAKGVTSKSIRESIIMFISNQVLMADFFAASVFETSERRKDEDFMTGIHMDMKAMYEMICDYLNVKNFVLGTPICNDEEQSIKDLIARKLLKNDRHARPIINYGCKIFKASIYHEYLDYDDLDSILRSHLYPNGGKSERVVYDWVQGEERAAASKVPVPSIKEIVFPEAKS